MYSLTKEALRKELEDCWEAAINSYHSEFNFDGTVLPTKSDYITTRLAATSEEQLNALAENEYPIPDINTSAEKYTDNQRKEYEQAAFIKGLEWKGGDGREIDLAKLNQESLEYMKKWNTEGLPSTVVTTIQMAYEDGVVSMFKKKTDDNDHIHPIFKDILSKTAQPPKIN